MNSIIRSVGAALHLGPNNSAADSDDEPIDVVIQGDDGTKSVGQTVDGDRASKHRVPVVLSTNASNTTTAIAGTTNGIVANTTIAAAPTNVTTKNGIFNPSSVRELDLTMTSTETMEWVPKMLHDTSNKRNNDSNNSNNSQQQSQDQGRYSDPYHEQSYGDDRDQDYNQDQDQHQDQYQNQDQDQDQDAFEVIEVAPLDVLTGKKTFLLAPDWETVSASIISIYGAIAKRAIEERLKNGSKNDQDETHDSASHDNKNDHRNDDGGSGGDGAGNNGNDKVDGNDKSGDDPTSDVRARKQSNIENGSIGGNSSNSNTTHTTTATASTTGATKAESVQSSGAAASISSSPSATLATLSRSDGAHQPRSRSESQPESRLRSGSRSRSRSRSRSKSGSESRPESESGSRAGSSRSGSSTYSMIEIGETGDVEKYLLPRLAASNKEGGSVLFAVCSGPYFIRPYIRIMDYGCFVVYAPHGRWFAGILRVINQSEDLASCTVVWADVFARDALASTGLLDSVLVIQSSVWAASPGGEATKLLKSDEGFDAVFASNGDSVVAYRSMNKSDDGSGGGEPILMDKRPWVDFRNEPETIGAFCWAHLDIEDSSSYTGSYEDDDDEDGGDNDKGSNNDRGSNDLDDGDDDGDVDPDQHGDHNHHDAKDGDDDARYDDARSDGDDDNYGHELDRSDNEDIKQQTNDTRASNSEGAERGNRNDDGGDADDNGYADDGYGGDENESKNKDKSIDDNDDGDYHDDVDNGDKRKKRPKEITIVPGSKIVPSEPPIEYQQRYFSQTLPQTLQLTKSMRAHPLYAREMAPVAPELDAEAYERDRRQRMIAKKAGRGERHFLGDDNNVNGDPETMGLRMLSALEAGMDPRIAEQQNLAYAYAPVPSRYQSATQQREQLQEQQQKQPQQQQYHQQQEQRQQPQRLKQTQRDERDYSETRSTSLPSQAEAAASTAPSQMRVKPQPLSQQPQRLQSQHQQPPSLSQQQSSAVSQSLSQPQPRQQQRQQQQQQKEQKPQTKPSEQMMRQRPGSIQSQDTPERHRAVANSRSTRGDANARQQS